MHTRRRMEVDLNEMEGEEKRVGIQILRSLFLFKY